MNEKIIQPTPAQAPATPKCPFLAMPVRTDTGQIAVMGADGFCPMCLFYSQLLKKCEVRMLIDKILYNK